MPERDVVIGCQQRHTALAAKPHLRSRLLGIAVATSATLAIALPTTLCPQPFLVGVTSSSQDCTFYCTEDFLYQFPSFIRVLQETQVAHRTLRKETCLPQVPSRNNTVRDHQLCFAQKTPNSLLQAPRLLLVAFLPHVLNSENCLVPESQCLLRSRHRQCRLQVGSNTVCSNGLAVSTQRSHDLLLILQAIHAY